MPYVPSGEIPLLPREARDHEAHVALDGGGDGLDVLRRVATEASAWLAPGGHLLTESGERQAAGAVAVLGRAGLVARVVRADVIGAREVVGTLPSEPWAMAPATRGSGATSHVSAGPSKENVGRGARRGPSVTQGGRGPDGRAGRERGRR